MAVVVRDYVEADRDKAVPLLYESSGGMYAR